MVNSTIYFTDELSRSNVFIFIKNTRWDLIQDFSTRVTYRDELQYNYLLSNYQKSFSRPVCQAITSVFLFALLKIPAMNSIYLSLFFYFVLAN